ncbi:glucokinase [Capsulimonas corticalis]|uniref:Glucokinase n=1 Tax=Capsulimonas corticalis TaxID=2219043 RepID=A0A402CU61_9BACT|nr:ROK family protein [Capsulimonas corticalis]BDI28851.1 glucokinase [Capsulimonas corticalis]
MTDQDPRYAIGVDVGGTRTKIGLVDLDRGVVDALSVEPTVKKDGPAFLDSLRRGIATVTATRGVRPSGVGIAVPGFVDTERRRISDVWDDLDYLNADGFPARAAEVLGLPCFWDNDARCAGLGESRYGAGAGARRLLALTLGTGVGFAFLIDGQFPELSPVTHLGAHFPLRSDGPECWCGLQGCFEALVSSSGLLERIPPALRPRSSSEIFAAALESPPITQAVKEYLDDLRLGLEIFARTLAPDVIVLGGGVSHRLGHYLNDLQITIQPYAGYQAVTRISELQESAGVIGAAALTAG